MERIREEILALKEKTNAVILAHNYQIPDIQDIADFVGDSLELAMKAVSLEGYGTIAFCGVRFMAETAKILNPSKKVLLAAPDAGCPMADMAEESAVKEMKDRYPDAGVVCYVNSSAEVKALSDACCTSSNAAEVARNISAARILFLPDKNLAWFVQQRVPEKKIIPWDGWCFVHRKFTVAEVELSRKKFSDAEIIVHPECDPEVQSAADYVCSTSHMLKRAKESSAKTFIIGTEEGMLYRLAQDNPDKRFFCLGSPKFCVNMKKTTLTLLRDGLARQDREIVVPSDVAERAARALAAMLNFTGK
ncbi:MAG: quinolinate synthase NadA [Candidatus Ratteibacteria bacterium]|jgi:quinolinate synthase